MFCRKKKHQKQHTQNTKNKTIQINFSGRRYISAPYFKNTTLLIDISLLRLWSFMTGCKNKTKRPYQSYSRIPVNIKTIPTVVLPQCNLFYPLQTMNNICQTMTLINNQSLVSDSVIFGYLSWPPHLTKPHRWCSG